jgi:phosphoserine phosphatase
MREFEQFRTIVEITAARAEMAGWYEGRSQAELCGPLADATLAPGVHAGFAHLRQHGIVTALVSITWDFAVAWFARTLNVDYYVGTRLAEDGTIAHFWPDDKARWLRALAADLGVALDQIAAVGDSSGDVPMLQAVGLPYFVGQDLPPELHAATHMPDGDIDRIARSIIAAGG